MKWSAGAHGSTFGGNPVACAAALATLDLVEGSLTDNAAAVGDAADRRGCRSCRRAQPLLTEVRGRGLMIGIDFPDHDTAAAIEQACFRRGLLVLTCGERAVRFAPALTDPARPGRDRGRRSWPTPAPRSRPERARLRSRAAGLPVAVEAHGCEIIDADGKPLPRRVLGCGRGQPRPRRRVRHRRRSPRQLATVDSVHATTFTTEALEEYAAELAPLVPVADARVYPVSGGSEAIETACKLARAYHLARGEPDRHVVLARHGSYHGNTRGALDLSGPRPAARAVPPVARPDRAGAGDVPVPGRRSRARSTRPRLDETIEHLGAGRVAAFVAEPIGGATTGASVPPDDYWPAVAEVCRRHGVLLDRRRGDDRASAAPARGSRATTGACARRAGRGQGRVERVLAARARRSRAARCTTRPGRRRLRARLHLVPPSGRRRGRAGGADADGRGRPGRAQPRAAARGCSTQLRDALDRRRDRRRRPRPRPPRSASSSSPTATTKAPFPRRAASSSG